MNENLENFGLALKIINAVEDAKEELEKAVKYRECAEMEGHGDEYILLRKRYLEHLNSCRMIVSETSELVKEYVEDQFEKLKEQES